MVYEFVHQETVNLFRNQHLRPIIACYRRQNVINPFHRLELRRKEENNFAGFAPSRPVFKGLRAETSPAAARQKGSPRDAWPAKEE
jgi:hypothetical protein